jgi:hypothetical protein
MLQWSPRLAALLLVAISIAAVLAHAIPAARSFGWG